MEQLTIEHILNLVSNLRKQYTLDEIKAMPIYIGDDDELNGIHTGWCCQLVCNDNSADNEYIIEMINERAHNVKFKDKAILIS